MLKDNERKEIREYLLKVNQTLNRNEQISSYHTMNEDYNFLISHMIPMANHDNPGLNIKMVNNVSQFPLYVKNMVDEDEISVRFIVFVNNSKSVHAVAFDCYHFKGKGVSILGIEPANSIKHTFPNEIAIRCKNLNFTCVPVPKVSLHILSSRQQNSQNGCMMYSLALAKMLFKEREKLLPLHEKNLNNGFEVEESIESVIKVTDTDKYLLPSLMKHCQSTNRVKEYLLTGLDREVFGDIDKKSYSCNKRNETLIQRHKRTLTHEGVYCSPVIRQGVTYNNSIYLKRKRELERLLGLLD